MAMLEKVARAIHEAIKESDVDWADEAQEIKTTFLIMSRAAIKAMREPTEDMVNAGVAGIDAVEGDCATEEGTSAGYAAMIDAALSERES